MIKIIAVGKIKEQYLKEAIDEYLRRLSAYSKVQVVQVPDEKIEEKEKRIEAEGILKNIKDDDYVITLEIEGKQKSSEELSELISGLEVTGHSSIVFVIGGSLGLHESVSERANYKLSFSRMTFPHQLMRVILLEQIYRAYKIMKGEPYHK